MVFLNKRVERVHLLLNSQLDAYKKMMKELGDKKAELAGATGRAAGLAEGQAQTVKPVTES